MNRRYPAMLSMAGAVLLASAGAAPAPDPEVAWRLPAPVVLDASAGAEGRVIFDHATHLAFLGPRCTFCHPGTFSILGNSSPIVHDVMNAGRSCGACHNGERAPATGSEEACTTCHTGWGPREPGMLTDVPLESAGSPGVVVFHHATHAGAGLACSACHPDPFALKLAGTPVAATGSGHEGCARCHDGGRAFDLEEASCESCHRQEASP